jgi:H+/Cl- antiporter ClcA
MDDIDITTPEFSLSRVPDLTEIVSNIVHTTDPELPDYAMYILGAMLMALAGIVFLYKFTRRVPRVTFQDKLDDCYGDKCHP